MLHLVHRGRGGGGDDDASRGDCGESVDVRAKRADRLLGVELDEIVETVPPDRRRTGAERLLQA